MAGNFQPFGSREEETACLERFDRIIVLPLLEHIAIWLHLQGTDGTEGIH